MRGKQTVRDMVLSLAVIGVAAALMYLFIPHDESKDPVRTVDYRVELETARRAAPYKVAAPQGLGEGWRATSVTYKGVSEHGAVWHLGFLNPNDEYVAVEQGDGPERKFVEQVTRDAEKTERTQRVGDQEWTRWEGPKYDALVRTEGGVTTVVTGTAPFEDLARMAAALRTS
ncbi:DUF4245 domain-containing protein [Streptomyces sp. URMC 123]|uniref:DUF4245 domain-containing protein n=1 Tax=Streptomyces sp. URMC 123 TaxID=3423403 RepID=UPI003F1B82FA